MVLSLLSAVVPWLGHDYDLPPLHTSVGLACARPCPWHWQVRGWGCEVGHTLALALGAGVWFTMATMLVALLSYCLSGPRDDRRRRPWRPKTDWLLIGLYPLWYVTT